MKNLEEIIGKKFGRLTVIKRVEIPKNRKGKNLIFYLCKCDCGEETVIFRNHIINGHTQSCGCYKKEKFGYFKDLTGEKFGKLLVIKRVNNNSKGKSQFLCKCDCGNEKIISSANLVSKNTISCGCYHKKTNHLPDGEAALNAIYASYKQGAKVRNLAFSLSKERFFETIRKDCYYCGASPSNKYKYKNGFIIYNGIDRINNNKGYIENNIVPCCWKCNSAKNKMSVDEFYEWVDEFYDWIDRVYKHKRGDDNG